MRQSRWVFDHDADPTPALVHRRGRATTFVEVIDRLRLPLYALALWSVAVWASRIRNVLGDEELDDVGTAWRVGIAVAFVVGGLLLALTTARHDHRLGAIGWGLVGLTVVWWLIRGVGILLDSNHDAGFKFVHTVLMLVSFAFAAWAARHLRATDHEADGAPV